MCTQGLQFSVRSWADGTYPRSEQHLCQYNVSNRAACKSRDHHDDFHEPASSRHAMQVMSI